MLNLTIIITPKKIAINIIIIENTPPNLVLRLYKYQEYYGSNFEFYSWDKDRLRLMGYFIPLLPS